ncbi:MAG: aminoglycoside phosphotransferase family protein [Dehalococcoidia bacterium]|nr:aminoglycoside phosphotransferase family protein [Dehalococcoidia bacterium]
MGIDFAAIAVAIGLPAGAACELEPLSPAAGAPIRAEYAVEGGPSRAVLVRPLHDDRARNHAAVLEALANRGFAHAARPLAFMDDELVEEWVDGVTALAVVPPAGALAAGVDALAALHALDVREGIRWGQAHTDVLPEEEVPLHRLGFAADEREPAREPLEAIREALLDGPFGFVHGNATAGHVLFARDRVVLTGFGDAGFGPKLADVAAFLATCGADAAERRELAARYAAARGLDARATCDLVDCATLWWGLQEQLVLPRRMIEALGDEAAAEGLRLSATRIERALREPIGDAPEAQALRAALWPS